MPETYCPKCDHMTSRHEEFEDGTVMCLTGHCRTCGPKRLKKAPAKMGPSNPTAGSAYRQYQPKTAVKRKPMEDELL